jgi:hypothetical protein
MFGFFKNLNHLYLHLVYGDEESDEQSVEESNESNQIRCESLKELKQLTHLIISELVLTSLKTLTNIYHNSNICKLSIYLKKYGFWVLFLMDNKILE